MKWFRRNQEADAIRGELGYFGLGEWWVKTFTREEREHIEAVYQPFGAGPGRHLTSGEISSPTATAAGVLWGLAGWFNKPGQHHLARKILVKADAVAGEPLDRHFTLQQLIEVNYADRNNDPTAFDTAIRACERQIDLAPKAAKAFRSAYPNSPLPSHVGYTQLAIVREKQGNYAEAIRLSRQAHAQGWAGNWEHRIARCEMRMAKKGNG